MTSLMRNLMTVALLFFCFSLAQAQDAHLPVIFKSEGSQISFTVKKELLPVISHIGLNVFTPDFKSVHEQMGLADQSLVWAVKEMSPYTEGDTYLYVGAVTLKPIKGDVYVLPGQIMQSGKKLEFRLMKERPSNIPGFAPVEFYKSLTEIAPNNGAAWFFYGVSVCEQSGTGFSADYIMPPPPPAAPPLPGKFVVNEIRPSKEEQEQIDEENRKWKAKVDALQKDLKSAQPAFVKAAELAVDCQFKDAAMAYLAAIALEFDDTQLQKQWLFKRIESPCATNRAKAESYYLLGVKQWARAYDLTGKYTNKKVADPFHFRIITNPADKQQLDNCISTAAQYFEKSLEADPKFADAVFYKSLIYREKQKVTANPVERKRLNDEAVKLTARGRELMKQIDSSNIK